ncbi:HAMP domain-containing protein [Candidatus Dependentiae bacterium]|nr:HAMP domain-containing protein [Candidatus Dependentiae bacterium]
MSLTIKKRLVIYFLLTALIPLIAIFWIGISTFQSSKEKDIVQNYANVEKTFIDNIEKSLFERMKNIKLWSKFPVMEEVIAMDLDGNISKFITQFKKDDIYFLDMVVTDMSGKVVASSNGKYINQSLADEPGFAESVKSGFIVQDMRFSKFFSSNVILMFNPITSSKNISEKYGMLVAAFDCNTLIFEQNDKLNLTGNQSNGQSDKAFVQLFNSENFIISSPGFFRGKDIILKNKNDVPEVAERLKTENSGLMMSKNKIIVYTKSDGHKAGNDELQSLNWYAVAEIDKSLAFADINNMKILMIIFLIVISLVVFLISYYVSSKITKPIIKITDMGNKLAKGDLNIDSSSIQWKNDDELGQLSTAFSNIVSSQKKLVEQANCISSDDLTNKILDTKIEGDLGEAFSKMTLKLRGLADQARIIANDDLYNNLLTTDGTGTLSKAFADVVINLRGLTDQAQLIANDKLNNEALSIKGEGTLSRAFAEMTINLRKFAELAKLISDGKLSSDKLQVEDKGVLSNAFYEMILSLKKLSEQAGAIARGELNHPVLSESVKGELGDNFRIMTNNLRKLISNLENIIMEVKNVAGVIDNVTVAVNTTSNDFINQSKDQALLTNDTDTALTQFSSSVQEIALNCDKSKQISKNTIEAIKSGMQIMSQVTQEMENINESIKLTSHKLDELNDSSRKISNIVDIITGISEKTSLLALNAAIEAARAGESGRGFAVVADEVNKLAEQTNKSVKEISLLVDTIKVQTTMSVESMNNGRTLITNGVQLVDKASSAFSNIHESIEETNTSIIEISDAVKEQTNVIDSIVRTTDKLKNISKQVMEKSQELRTKGETLNDNSKKLQVLLKSN